MVRKPRDVLKRLALGMALGDLLTVLLWFIISGWPALLAYAVCFANGAAGWWMACTIFDWLDDNDDWPDQLKRGLAGFFSPKVAHA